MSQFSLVCAVLLFGCTRSEPPTPPPLPAPASDLALPSPAPPWPEAGALLWPPAVVQGREDHRPVRIFIEPGHGNPGNAGNTSCRCRPEQDFTLALGRDLTQRLSDSPHLNLRIAGGGETRPPYRQRIADAESWGADALISLHSDTRGAPSPWQPPGRDGSCSRNDEEPGFTVLWSDEGPAELVRARLALARALARRLSEAGFLAYHGADYGPLYEVDDEVPGVFVDRHAPHQRIMMLRRPRVPSVIIETHHAWDSRETARWEEPATREVFAAAVAAAVLDLPPS